jgi:centromere protein S
MELDKETILKLELHRSIGMIAKEKAISLTPEVHLVMSELLFEQIKSFGRDLELFSKHGKRSTITIDDLKLLMRKLPGIQDIL